MSETKGPWTTGVAGDMCSLLIRGPDAEIVAEYFFEADGELIARAPEMAEENERLRSLNTHFENRIADDQKAIHGVALQCEKFIAQRDALVSGAVEVLAAEDQIAMDDVRTTAAFAELRAASEAAQ